MADWVWILIAIPMVWFCIYAVTFDPAQSARNKRQNQQIREQRALQGRYPTAVHPVDPPYRQYLTPADLEWVDRQLALASAQ